MMVRRVDKPVRVPTPPRIEVVPPKPLTMYSDQFKEQALKNVVDWIAREENCALYGDEEERMYEQDFEKYKVEYVKWIESYQDELSLESQNNGVQKEQSAETDEAHFDKVLEMSNLWNASIQAKREEYIESLRNTPNIGGTELSSDVKKTDLIDSPLLDPEYLPKLIEVKMKRLENIVTEENLDERIASALNSPPVDFNFAIDTQGEIHKGSFFNKKITKGSSEFGSSLIGRGNEKRDPIFSESEVAPLNSEDDSSLDELLEEFDPSDSTDIETKLSESIIGNHQTEEPNDNNK